MNRDVILATSIGLGLGLVITLLVVFGPRVLVNMPSIQLPKFNIQFLLPQSKNDPGQNQTQPDKKPAEFGITVSSPQAESIVTSESLLVSGTTSPKSLVVIQGYNDDTVIEADEEGKYQGEVTLDEGKNDVFVTSYLDDKMQSQKIVVYYTQEKL